MTTPDPTPPAATDPDVQDPPQGAADVPDAAGQGESDPAGEAGREAARYRVRARDAEAARDALAAQVLALQRREAERLAGERLSVAADLWDVGRTRLQDVLGDDGTVDPGKVTAALDELVKSRPGLNRHAVRQVRPDPSQGGGLRRGERGDGDNETGQAWSDLLSSG